MESSRLAKEHADLQIRVDVPMGSLGGFIRFIEFSNPFGFIRAFSRQILKIGSGMRVVAFELHVAVTSRRCLSDQVDRCSKAIRSMVQVVGRKREKIDEFASSACKSISGLVSGLLSWLVPTNRVVRT